MGIFCIHFGLQQALRAAQQWLTGFTVLIERRAAAPVPVRIRRP